MFPRRWETPIRGVSAQRHPWRGFSGRIVSAPRWTTRAYNAAGQWTGQTDRNGRVRNFGYDAVGRRTSETWLNSLSQVIYTATYTFDAAGNRSGASDNNSVYAYGYDAAHRLTSVDNLGTPGVPHVVLSYGYDVYNNRVSLNDNVGGAISFAFDADHRLTTLQIYTGSPSMTLDAQVTFGYDAASRLTGITRSNTGIDTITSAYSYDNANRLTNITHTDTTKVPALTLASYTYGYDAANQLTSYSGPDGSLSYGYDNFGQLTSVTGARTENFTYDKNGNRTMAGYTTGAANRLTSDGVYNYTYDNEGNMLTQTRISDGQVTNYTWDYRNRLTQVQVKSSTGTVLNTETFTYDVNNNRIGMLVNGTQTWTIFDGANPYIDSNGSGVVTERYLTNPQGLSQFYARVNGSGMSAPVNWYLTDNIGSVRQIVDSSGNVLDTLVYGSFGNIVSESNQTNGDRFKYAGGANDSITGDNHFGRREEKPTIGRFTSQDPESFRAGDTDLYRYVFNAPTSRIDPSGLLPPGNDPFGLFYYNIRLMEAVYGEMVGHPMNWELVQAEAVKAYHGGVASHELQKYYNAAKNLLQDYFKAVHFDWPHSTGFFGCCFDWVEKYVEETERLSTQLAEAKYFTVERQYWDNKLFSWVPTEYRPGHAAIKITYNGFIYYIDDGNLGGSGHVFLPSDVPSYYVPTSTIPVLPPTPKGSEH